VTTDLPLNSKSSGEGSTIIGDLYCGSMVIAGAARR
jgi:hypothetical protein